MRKLLAMNYPKIQLTTGSRFIEGTKKTEKRFDGRREATRAGGADRENERAMRLRRAHFRDPLRPR